MLRIRIHRTRNVMYLQRYKLFAWGVNPNLDYQQQLLLLFKVQAVVMFVVEGTSCLPGVWTLTWTTSS